MAIRATFTADISQFERAVAQTQDSLKGFGLRTDDLGKALQRMAQQFDGSKIIREANLAAAAVEHIGGVAKLTEAEQKRLNSTVTEALAKYRALGQQAPDALHQLAKATEAANKQSGLLGCALTQVKTIAAGFVAGFTVDRVVTGLTQAVGATVAYGDAISDLSDKTGVSTTALQRWDYAAKQTGTTLDTMVNAAQEVSKRLGEGGDSVRGAVEALGLSFDELRQQSPEQQFTALAQALGTVQDQAQQSAIGADLFGRSWKEVIGPVRAGFVELGDEAERLGAVIDEQTVKAMGALADSWQALKDSGRGLIATVLEPMVPAFQQIAEAARNAAKAIREDWWGALLKINQAASAGPMGFGAVLAQQFGGGGKAAGGGTGKVTTAESYFVSGVDNVAAGVSMRDLADSGHKAARALERVASSATLADANIFNRDRSSAGLMQRLPQVPASLLGGGGLTETLAGYSPWGGVGMLAPGASTFVAPPTLKGLNWGSLGLSGITAAMPWLSQAIAGGSKGGQIGGSVGGSIGGVLGSSSMLGGLSGLGGFAGVLGAAAPFLGPALGIVGSLVGKLFGPSKGAILGKEADQRIGQLQSSLLQQYGSVENIAGMGSGGAAVAAAWGSKNVEGEAHFKRLVELFQEQRDLDEQIVGLEEQRKALAEQLVPTYQQVAEAAATLGIDVNALGPAVAQLGANEAWKAIIDSLETITRATGDVGGALSQSAGTLSKMVQEAIRAGTAIPANMKPYITELIRTGQLLDENGEAITDITQIKWGDAIASQADVIKSAMDALDATLAKLTERLEAIANSLAGIPGAAATASTAVNGIPGGERGSDPYTPMAAGGIVTRPTYALIGEAGPEAVIPLHRARRSTPLVVQVALDGRVIAESVVREMPGLMPAFGF